ncbi:hypothetical protein K7432_011248 [Basidiobolus ranarum]|uniref:Secreted protein n=1 Tax=Basidiobolus ranarum TaxID=34480 RepID=A0ABR2VU94_9FUNG
MFNLKLLTMTLAGLVLFISYIEAHSWVDCMDWRFKNAKKRSFDDNAGECRGFARRYLVKSKGGKFTPARPFGSQDSASPNRHYKQAEKRPNDWPACSTGKRYGRGEGEEVGADETRANPISKAYGGKWGPMTVAKAGKELCVRWPAKNHKNEPKNIVYINMAPTPLSKDPTQKQLNKWTIAKLNYGNCFGGGSDRARCGGCFTIPKDRKPGDYLIQWRWMLRGSDNVPEWYTSCSDIRITK